MIDWNRVTELRSEIGEEDFLEVVDLFLAEVGEALDRLSSHTDPAHLEGDFHFLKGCALNLGFREFSNLCRSGEYAVASGDFGKVDIPDLLNTFERSKVEFLQSAPAPCRAG